MKIIQYIDGVVVDILNIRNDATTENVTIVDSIPTYEPRDGYSGILKYDTVIGLYWDYTENPLEEERQVSSDEFYSMIEGVL